MRGTSARILARRGLFVLFSAIPISISLPTYCWADAAEVHLSDLWHPSSVGVVVQVGSDRTLVIDAPKSGGSYVLDGKRLVIRAANVTLIGSVVIESYIDRTAPDAPAKFDTAANTGKHGRDGIQTEDWRRQGGDGDPGQTGADGSTGRTGFPAGPITLNFGHVDGSGSLVVIGNGSHGSVGQQGQEGGQGGTAGIGGDSAKTYPDCSYGGGDAGKPGPGGAGGWGGKGGTGGASAIVRVSSAVKNVAVVVTDGFSPPPPGAGKIVVVVSGGPGGGPGLGGRGGAGGHGNLMGAGGGACGGGKGSNDLPRTPDQTEDLGLGDRGPAGSVVEIQ